MTQQPDFGRRWIYRGVDETGETVIEDEFARDEDAVNEFQRRLEGTAEGQIEVFARWPGSDEERQVTTFRL